MKQRGISQTWLILSLSLLVAVAITDCSPKIPPDVSVPLRPGGNAVSCKYATETYRTVASDRSGNQVRCVFDWGDGTFDTTGFFGGRQPDTVSAAHTWLTEDTFSVKALAINSKGETSPHWSDELVVTVGPNDRPNPPDRIGGAEGAVRNQYIRFWTKSTDPNGDSIYIKFVYDTTRPSHNSGWLGPVACGTYVYDSTKYDSAGTYYLAAYAKDTKGAISEPSVLAIYIRWVEFMPWSFIPPGGYAFNSSPAINTMTGDTIVYCGCDNGVFYSFDARNGGHRGDFTSLNQDAFTSSPSISTDGQRVYIADDGGWLYCLNAADLNSISHYPPNDTWMPGMLPFFSSPAVHDAAVYIGRDDGYFYCFDDNAGQLTCRDSYVTSAAIKSSPAINSDGTRIVVGNDSGYVYCFNDTLGLVWKVYSGAPIRSSPAINGNTVYYGSDDQILHAVSLVDGGLVGMQFTANDFIMSTPIVDDAGNVYFCVDNGTVYCINSGAEVWHAVLPYGEHVSATCCLAPDTTLIINTDDGSVYGLDVGTVQPGAVRYRIEWPLPPMRARRHKTNKLGSSVTIGPGMGMFYAGSSNGGFFSVGVDKSSFVTGSLPNTPWPKFHHDIQNSGWAH